MTTILDLLEDASSHPSDVIFLPNQALSTTFENLWRLSEKTAAYFSRWPRGTAIGGILTATPDMIAVLLGAWRAGLRFVSMPLPGRAQTPASYRELLEAIVGMAGLEAVVADDKYADALPPPSVPLLAASRCQSAASSARLHEVGDFVQFSSGTTGSPKGVCLSLSAVGAAVLAQIEALEVRPGDVGCFWVPLSHDFGLIGGLLSSWAASCSRYLSGTRGCFVALDPLHFVTNPWSWMAACAEYRATITGGPAFAYGIAAREFERRGVSGNLSALRACVIGAEPINAATIETFVRAGAAHGVDDAAMCPAYGLAEATLAVTMKPVTEPWRKYRPADAEAFRDFGVGRGSDVVCTGRPVKGVEIAILNATDVGEICVRGPSLMSCYLDRKGNWTETGWLRTGDVGFLRDDSLYVLGREDGVLTIGGQNASATEMEKQLERHPEVRPGNCAVCSDGAGRYVVAVEHRAGHAEPSVLAAVPLALRAGLVREFGVAPSAVLVLPPGTLPKTPSGKLQRNRLLREWDDLARAALSKL